jgi:RHS repeat-associated protein
MKTRPCAGFFPSLGSYNFKHRSLKMDWYDYGFRFYDPALARFPSLDPLADKFYHLSPYNYASNSPIAMVDLWGLQGAWFFEVGPMLERESINRGIYMDDGSFPSMQNAVQYSNRSEKRAQIDAYTAAGVNGLIAIGGELLLTAKPVNQLIGKAKGAVRSLLKSGDEAIKAGDDLATRAKEIHSALPEATQNRTTTAVAEVTNPDGTVTKLVGSSEKRLRPAQRGMLSKGEVAVAGEGHAEATVINSAQSSGQQVNRVAASRPICPECEEVIKNAGASAASPLKR